MSDPRQPAHCLDRRSSVRAMARNRSLVLLPLIAVAIWGCGGGDDSGNHQPALTEKDPSGDVLSVRPWREGIADRPQLDLRGAGIDTNGRRIQIHVTTAAPPRDAIITFAGRQHDDCVDAQLAVEIRVPDEGPPTVGATDRGDEPPMFATVRPRSVRGASLTIDGTHVVASLPLRRHARFAAWNVFLRDARDNFRDAVPDYEAVGFARGTGGRNEVGRFCGPARPPLLRR